MLAILTQYQLSAVFIWIIDISHDTRAEGGGHFSPHHIRPVKAMTKHGQRTSLADSPHGSGVTLASWAASLLLLRIKDGLQRQDRA